MKVGDKVRVICESDFDNDNGGKIRHCRKLNDICEVIFIEKPNKVGGVVFTKDKYEKLSLDEERGQYINTCDLEVINE